jgi:hypothetical protein
VVIVGRPKASTLKLVSYCIHESTDALHFSSPCSVYCAAFWAEWAISPRENQKPPKKAKAETGSPDRRVAPDSTRRSDYPFGTNPVQVQPPTKTAGFGSDRDVDFSSLQWPPRV